MSAEPTVRDELASALRLYGAPYCWKASDLLEADQTELDALDAEVERQGLRIAELEALVRDLSKWPTTPVDFKAEHVYQGATELRAALNEALALVKRAKDALSLLDQAGTK